LKIKGKILLPGTDKQLSNFFASQDVSDKKILIIGDGSEEITEEFLNRNASEIDLIVENTESLSIARNYLSKKEKISVRLMDFDNTDFNSETFNIIYAQASISKVNRNKIIKEIKRILKPGGILCIGEIVKLKDKIPAFVTDILESSRLFPILINDLRSYYGERNFEILFEKDLSLTLKEFYVLNNSLLNENLDKLPLQEKSYHKKMLNQIVHESNAYLKMGADKYIGFHILVMRKA
jgi:ubiquinone/menaquinone biosynthesis C-methylase UbiE